MNNFFLENNNNNNNVIWLHDDENKYLTYTSKLLSINGLAGLYFGEKYFSLMILLTSLFSYNFWRKPKYDWRRTIDIYWTRLLTPIFFHHSIINIDNYYIKTIIPITYTGAIYLFLKAVNMHKNRNRMWYYNHYLAHHLVFFGHSLTIGYEIMKKKD